MTDRPTPDEAKRAVREALERFARGDSEVEEVVDPSGETLRLERDPDDPRRYLMKSGGVPRVEGVRFPASGTRPDGFPDDMPFVPDAVGVLNLHLATGARVLRWEDLPYARDWKKQVVAALRESGWGDPETDLPDAIHPSEVRFRVAVPPETPGVGEGAGGGAGEGAGEGAVVRRVVLTGEDHHRGDLMVVEEGER